MYHYLDSDTHYSRIKRMTATALRRGHEKIEARLGIVGILSLYLDFINLFLRLLHFKRAATLENLSRKFDNRLFT